MNPFTLIRKLGKALRGGATFRDMFLGAFLGFAIGMIPGINMTLILLIFLLLFMNTTGALAGLTIFLGKMLSLVLAPITFRVGYVMIHDFGMVSMVRSASETPVVALMDLHVYCLLGAIPLIIIIGIPLAWIVAGLIVKARASLAAKFGDSEKVEKVSSNKFVRFLMWIVFGKQKGKLADMDNEKSPLIRKGRVIIALVVIVIIAAVQWIYLDSMVKRGLEQSISFVSGAEVNIDQATLSLSDGRLVIKGFQVTDAGKPTHNRLQAEQLVADISIMDLLRRRFVVDLSECDAIRMNTLRKTPGKVYRKASEVVAEAQPSVEKLTGTLVESAEGSEELKGLIGEKHAKQIDTGKKHIDTGKRYYAEVKKFNKQLTQLKKYLKSSDPSEPQAGEQPGDASVSRRDADFAQAKKDGYLKVSAKNYLAKTPTWVIRKIKVSRIQLREDLPTFTAVGTDISGQPSLHNKEAELTASPDEEALNAFIAKLAKKAGIKGDLPKDTNKLLKGDLPKDTGGLLDKIKDDKKDEKDEKDKKDPKKKDKSLLDKYL